MRADGGVGREEVRLDISPVNLLSHLSDGDGHTSTSFSALPQFCSHIDHDRLHGGRRRSAPFKDLHCLGGAA